ncbi:MAG TPA: HPF/RaiA family ribosome-associated protein [Burkholderiales bacterium]|nr:HPF/RaiA family ribosome-associated protein [Burkholderiales bacterium]
MQTPLQITFRHLPRSDALEARIRERATALEEFFPHIVSCRVVVEEESRHKQQGRMLTVRVDLHLPGHELAVNREHDQDPFVAVRDAFDALRRQLEDQARVMRGDVKDHAPEQHGRVARLFPGQGYGFIATADGREFYFSSDNVVTPSFDGLTVDAEVQFIEGAGAEGPQAKRVSVGKHHAQS